jgi:conjugative relaxase-like TrwC/TraI family protein
VAIGLVKLGAGSGYEYLVRQVAVQDATGLGRGSLADYYTAKGESPGTWYGRGLAGLRLEEGSVVSAEQMKLLFGAGLDPTTGAKLGRAFSVFANTPTPFETELAHRLEAWRDTHNLNAGSALPKAVREELRTGLAREWFAARYGRPPAGPRELHGFIAKNTRRPRIALAGWDVTLSPPKSVSSLWAIAPPPLAAAIRQVHDAAVTDTLAECEARVLFTRQGHQGARHVPVRGMVAGRFTHRDSRAGDPDLHTHVAISNKVQTLQCAWMAINGELVYDAKVTLSEVYLTSLTARLRALGLTMVAVGREDKRPVYEIAGVDPALNRRWSTRRETITKLTGQLVAEFEDHHERPPTAAEKLDLEQQATLATRESKHPPRAEIDQRRTWAAQATRLLGRGGIERILHQVFSRDTAPPVVVVDDAWIGRTAAVVDTVQRPLRSPPTGPGRRAPPRPNRPRGRRGRRQGVGSGAFGAHPHHPHHARRARRAAPARRRLGVRAARSDPLHLPTHPVGRTPPRRHRRPGWRTGGRPQLGVAGAAAVDGEP